MQVPWRSMLTRERQVCRICFDAGVRPSVPLVPFADNLALLKSNHGAFNMKRKAALRRHVKTEHKNWYERISW